MRILELTLHGYKRIAVSGIETIRYTPESDVQIIIGSNGCGKSSLMNELSPLPAPANVMIDGGYKTIRIEHQGVIYRLHSTYNKSNRHSFVQYTETGEEVELNQGGTQMAQKILIEKTFGVTVDIMKIWLGRVKFTEMAPIKRRDWILKLSGNDLEFAMKYYNVVKAHVREAGAVDKHYAKRLAEESADIADKNRIEELEKTIVDITNDLNDIVAMKLNNLPSVATISVEIDALIREFGDLSSEVLTLHLVKPSILDNTHNNIGAVQNFLSNQKVRIEMLNAQLTELYEEKAKISSTVEALAENGVGDLEELTLSNKNLGKDIKALIDETPLYIKLGDSNIAEMIGIYKSCRNTLIEILSVMTDNTDRYFTNEKVRDTRQLVKELEHTKGASLERIQRLRHDIEHYTSTHSVDCPECKFNFKPGVYQIDPVASQAEIDRLVEKVSKVDEQLKEASNYLTEVSEYSTQVATLKRIIHDNPALAPLWEVLVDEGLYKVNPRIHLPTIQQFISHLETCSTIKDLQQKFTMNETVLTNVKQMQGSTDVYSIDYIAQMDEKIAAIISQIEVLKRDGRLVNQFHKEVLRCSECVIRINEIYNRLQVLHGTLLDAVKNRVLNQLSQQKQVVLATANSALNQISRHEAVLNELTTEKLKASDNLKINQVIMNSLSPVDGLISKYIQSFIDVFVADMNDVISDIWTTNLEILSCGVDSNDVTCKFPLSVQNGYFISEDIAEASEGQVDIINFAFRNVVGRYLGLIDFPLYIDELAPTLDELHRINIIRYLNNLIEDKQFNQMFMISHYASNHYAFSNSDILMLDERNIVQRPKEYNRHVQISYSTINTAEI